jgi:hypothetical protein
VEMSSGSLVKYNTPILVNLGANKKGKGEKKEKGPTVTQTEDILNSILPPREWTEDGQLWVQYVSSTPATRLDVVNLQQHLDHQLQARQARETGICPIREELYAQCFGKFSSPLNRLHLPPLDAIFQPLSHIAISNIFLPLTMLPCRRIN